MDDRPRVLIVDNHDSFVHTLVGYLQELGADTELVEADAVADAEVAIAGYAGVLVSPGPGTPEDAGASVAVVHAAAAARIPLLGVCLGHQALAVAFGATVSEAPELRHGTTSPVRHDGAVPFTGLPSPFTATRYHSLAVMPDTLPAELEVTAHTDAGVVMGLHLAACSCVIAICRCGACSSIPSRCSPRAGTSCSERGWSASASSEPRTAAGGCSPCGGD